MVAGACGIRKPNNSCLEGSLTLCICFVRKGIPACLAKKKLGVREKRHGEVRKPIGVGGNMAAEGTETRMKRCTGTMRAFEQDLPCKPTEAA